MVRRECRRSPVFPERRCDGHVQGPLMGTGSTCTEILNSLYILALSPLFEIDVQLFSPDAGGVPVRRPM